MTRLQRDSWLKTIIAAFTAGRPDVARNLATDWLAVWPGDCEFTCLLARAEYDEAMPENALARLRKLWISYPEFLPAYELAASVLIQLKEFNQLQTVNACIAALKNSAVPDSSPSWAANLVRAYALLNQHEYTAAGAAIEDVLALGPDLPLPSLIAAKVYSQSRPPEILESLLLQAQDRWPECVPLRLMLGQSKMRSGDTTLGVELLHQAAADDPAGLAAVSVFGTDNPYKNLWPVSIDAALTSAVPASVSAVLGENLLTGDQISESSDSDPVGKNADFASTSNEAHSVQRNSSKIASEINRPEITEEIPEDLPQPEPWESFRGPRSGDDFITGREALDEIKAEFDQLAERLRTDRWERQEDHHKPAYVILSSRTRLVQFFGAEESSRMDKALVNLALMVKRRPSWDAHIMYVDDPRSLNEFGLTPVDPGNAWQVKLRLADLSRTLQNRGERIGALLIVGNSDVIPFHFLPNPTTDDDEVIFSDNPYGSGDENYYAPEWPVGRFPSNNAEELLQAIYRATEYHRNPVLKINLLDRIHRWISRIFRRFVGTGSDSLGYSADIWRKAAMDVFRVIGAPRSLLTSPPVEAGPFPPNGSEGVRFSYFNLHGLEDDPEWFGQRDPFTGQGVEEFPIALRPGDILNSGSAPEIVFTEACYGANTIKKTSDTAISLKFLASGTHAVIGSTKISYGSVNPPLIAADLLSKLFWTHMKQQVPVGEALRQAKLKLAAEMHERQGFLDGEDQKTLISFVLYGDPLYAVAPGTLEKSLLRNSQRMAEMKVVSTSEESVLSEGEFDPSMLVKVKTIMASYLPGMSDAECVIQSPVFTKLGSTAGFNHSQAKVVQSDTGKHFIFSFSKDIPSASRIHSKFARVTIDQFGKIMKLAVSK